MSREERERHFLTRCENYVQAYEVRTHFECFFLIISRLISHLFLQS